MMPNLIFLNMCTDYYSNIVKLITSKSACYKPCPGSIKILGTPTSLNMTFKYAISIYVAPPGDNTLHTRTNVIGQYLREVWHLLIADPRHLVIE